MMRFDEDPFEDSVGATRRISQVTRRDVFDYIRTGGGPWRGRLDEVAFLARLYDQEKLASRASSTESRAERGRG